MALRTRAVAAYEAGEGGYVALAEQFDLGVNTLLRWVARARTGDWRPCRKAGWCSPVDATVVQAVATERPEPKGSSTQPGPSSYRALAVVGAVGGLMEAR